MTHTLDIGEMTIDTPLAKIKIRVGRTDRKFRPVVEITVQTIHPDGKPDRRLRVKKHATSSGVARHYREIVVTENRRRS